MPRLILLNGPSGIGKSTLARRYASEHPGTLCLDLDELRAPYGDPIEAGLTARAEALELAKAHLLDGGDVIVPQLLARPAFLEQLQALAVEVGAAWREVVLMDSKESALERYRRRADDPLLAEHHLITERTAGGAEGLAATYDRLADLVATRPHAVVIATRAGDPDGAYRDLLQVL